MTTYSFVGKSTTQFVNWDDATVWSGGVVPNAPDADVVFPIITQTSTGSNYTSFVSIMSNESYATRSVSIISDFLHLKGALSVSGTLALSNGGEIDMDGGTLSIGALQNNGYDIQGYGAITTMGALANSGLILGNDSGLTITAATLQNTGTLEGAVTVHATSAQGMPPSPVTLTGGTYVANSTLDLDLGGPIQSTNATIVIGQGTINSFVSGNYIPLQDTLRSIGATGVFQITDRSSYATSNTLTVAGAVSLVGSASLTAAQLTVTSGGSVGGTGTITGPISNDGTVTAGVGSQTNTPLVLAGPVSGSGNLVVGPGKFELVVPSQFLSFAISRSNLELSSPTSEAVRFADGTGVLTLDDVADFSGVITPAAAQSATTAVSPGTQPYTRGPFAAGPLPPTTDTVVLPGISLSSVTSATYSGNATGGTLTIREGATSQSLRFAGNFTTASFALSAGPQALSTSPPSLDIAITPPPASTTAGLVLVGGGTAQAAIVNTSTPVIAGVATTGASVAISANGVSEGVAASTVAVQTTTSPFSATLSPALGLGLQTITAVATNSAGSDSAPPVKLFVFPAPVNGISTAAFSSGDIAPLLQQGASMQFVSGTAAIQLTNGTLSVGPDTSEAFIQRLYEGLLGRAGDPQGLGIYDTFLAAGGTQTAVANSFLTSTEYQTSAGAQTSATDAQFLSSLYMNFLGRAPDQSGQQFWQNALANGASRSQIAAGFDVSSESKTYLAPDTAKIWAPNANGALMTQLFETGLGRYPDLGGLQGAIAGLKNGATSNQAAAGVTTSSEYGLLHSGQDATALVTSFYTAGLGRAPDQGGLQGWVGALNSGVSQGDVLLGIATSQEAALHLTPNI